MQGHTAAHHVYLGAPGRRGSKPDNRWRDLCVNFTQEYLHQLIAKVSAVLPSPSAGAVLSGHEHGRAAPAHTLGRSAEPENAEAATEAAASGAKRTCGGSAPAAGGPRRPWSSITLHNQN